MMPSTKVKLTPRRAALLFVYGTLRPFVDIPMSRWLAAAAVPVGEARVRGRLYDLGRYPGLLAPRRREEWVAGDLYRVTRRVLALLDGYEAGRFGRPVFDRVPCRVELRRAPALDGRAGAGPTPRERGAWLYLYRRPVLGRVRIASGDYRLHLRARPEPPVGTGGPALVEEKAGPVFGQ